MESVSEKTALMQQVPINEMVVANHDKSHSPAPVDPDAYPNLTQLGGQTQRMDRAKKRCRQHREQFWETISAG